VTTFAVTNAVTGLAGAIIAAVSVGSIILVWQLFRRESVRPASGCIWAWRSRSPARS
jgi:hypothetical protein